VCRLKISASAVKLGFEDEFWDGRDSVLVNGLPVRSILFAQKTSASDVELDFRRFLGPRTSFSSTVSEPAVVYVQ